MDIKGGVVIVTGSTTGVGAAAAKVSASACSLRSELNVTGFWAWINPVRFRRKINAWV